MRTAARVALGCVALLAAAPLQAEGDWTHEVAPYVWGAAMDGTAGIGNVQVDVDIGFDDILDNLEIGFMGAYRASRDRVSITVDTVYMALGASGRGPEGLVKGDVDVDQLAFEVNAGYAVVERLTVFGGLRYNDLSADLKATGPLGNSQSASQDEDWIDPIVGARYDLPFAERWSATLRGDIGGFGVGSDFAWQVVATLRWQASERVDLALAYRYFDMDYENGRGTNRFKYDMAISGPAVGAVFKF